MKTFVLAFTVLVLIAVPAGTQSNSEESGPHCARMMGMKMPASKLAEIRVYPMQQFNQDQADIARLRQIVSELRGKKESVGSKRRAELEEELFRVLDTHLERITSEKGKSETAVQVQTKLNRMEGKMMCGACHGMGGMHGGPRSSD